MLLEHEIIPPPWSKWHHLFTNFLNIRHHFRQRNSVCRDLTFIDSDVSCRIILLDNSRRRNELFQGGGLLECFVSYYSTFHMKPVFQATELSFRWS